MLAGRRLLAGIHHLRAVHLGKLVSALEAARVACRCGFISETCANIRCEQEFLLYVRSETVGKYSAAKAGFCTPGVFPGEVSLSFCSLNPLTPCVTRDRQESLELASV